MEAEIPPGSIGNLDTVFNSLARAASNAYDKGYDIGFLHVKGPYIAGHDKNYIGKVRIIEYIDAMMAEILNEINLEKTVVGLVSDHSTPCYVRDHSRDPYRLRFSP